MVKVDVIWCLVDAHPLDRLSVDWASALIKNRAVEFVNSHGPTESGQFRGALFDMLMTVPTGIGSWNVRMARMFDKTVTITTIQTQLTRMKVVVEVNRLCRLISDSLRLGRCIVGEAGNYADS